MTSEKTAAYKNGGKVRRQKMNEFEKVMKQLDEILAQITEINATLRGTRDTKNQEGSEEQNDL